MKRLLYLLTAVTMLMVTATSCDDNDEPKPQPGITAEYSLINRLDGTKRVASTVVGSAMVELTGNPAPCGEAPDFFANVERYCTPNPGEWSADYTSVIDGQVYPLQYFMPGSMINMPIDKIETRVLNDFDEAHPAYSSADDLLEVTFYTLDDWFAYKAGEISADAMMEKLGNTAEDPSVLEEPTFTPCHSSLVKDFKGTKGVISNRVQIRPVSLYIRPVAYRFEVRFYTGDRVVAQRLEFVKIM